MAENKNNGVKKIDDAKMNNVSGGFGIATNDPNFTYDVKTVVEATDKLTGKKFRDNGDGSGWKPVEDSTSQYGNQYGNNYGQW